MVQDEYGYFYFRDRSGDTFRWKGENVSTTEVEAVISSITGLKDCVVFGVKIPGTEGSAGMVTIADPEKSLDLQQLTATVNSSLPAYARPLFVRVSKEIETTGMMIYAHSFRRSFNLIRKIFIIYHRYSQTEKDGLTKARILQNKHRGSLVLFPGWQIRGTNC